VGLAPAPVPVPPADYGRPSHAVTTPYAASTAAHAAGQMHPLPQPSRPQPTLWSCADTYQQAMAGGSAQYYAQQGSAGQPWGGYPHGVGVSPAPAQRHAAYPHAFPGHQQRAAYSRGINDSAGSGGFATQSWWPQQQQQQAQAQAYPQAGMYQSPVLPAQQQQQQQVPNQQLRRFFQQPQQVDALPNLQPARQQMAHFASPSPWASAGGHPQGTAAFAAPLSNSPALSPPSAAFVPPQLHAPLLGQATQHGPVYSPAQSVFSAPQPSWAQQYPAMPTTENTAHGLPGLGTYGAREAGPVQPSTLMPGPGSIAAGVPIKQRPGATTATAHPQAASGPQLTGLADKPCLRQAAPAFPAPEDPQHSEQQTSRRPSPLPAAAAPMARPAGPQPEPQHKERPHVAAESTVQPAVDAGRDGGLTGGPLQGEAARLRRPADADAGERGKAPADI